MVSRHEITWFLKNNVKTGTSSSYLKHKRSSSNQELLNQGSPWSHEFYVNSRKKIDSLKADLDTEISRATANESLITSLNKDLLQAYKEE